jgi:ATP-binding cassette subfamily F protein 3
MSLVTAVELGVSFGGKPIFEDASFAIQPGERIRLVGPNGSGKTTLLRLLAREREPDEGDLVFARGVTCGYLPQDILELPDGSLVDAVRAKVRAAAGAPGDDTFDERYPRHRAEEILSGLGFATSAFGRPLATLSGGWKMRAALASLLLLGPDLLLLDEPTNHLDIPSLEWFDDFLRRSPRALLLISHDREFLNGQVRRILSLEVEGLRSYPGDYDAYRAQRAEEEEDLEIRAKRQAAQRAETMRFVERFRYKNTKAKQVQSRLKRLAREEVIRTLETRKTVRFHFPQAARSGRDVLALDGVDKRFGDVVVHQGITRTVTRGDRVAIIGVNGAGKSTLLKMMAGELAPDAGTITVGHNVSRAYFAQHHTELLDPAKTVLDEIWGLVPREGQTHVRSVLGAFLFSGDDVDKKIGVLSGGERARVALARLLVVPSNLLLMDEPTNHLDVASSERLVDALAEYDGTLVFVSHNRSFVNRLATKVWDLRGGDVHEWPGNLDAYVAHLRLVGASLDPAGAPARAADAPPRPESDRERRQREAREREELARRTRPVKDEIARVEAEIDRLEREKAELAPRIDDPRLYESFERSRPILDRWKQVGEELASLYRRWEEQHELLASIASPPPLTS